MCNRLYTLLKSNVAKMIFSESLLIGFCTFLAGYVLIGNKNN